jgi:hypothetical protein
VIADTLEFTQQRNRSGESRGLYVSSVAEPAPVILVSSPVYGIEDLLDQIFGMLAGFGYEVWMSHKGTVPVDPDKTAFENCLEAVERCDLFLGLITTSYGSGKEKGELSITHQELLRAIGLEKPRWFLAHDHVPFARQLLRQFRFNDDGTPNEGFVFKPTKVLDDIRVIDMYEAAIRDDKNLKERTGNWVQQYFRFDDATQFVSAQFSDIELMRRKLAEWESE